MNYIGNIITKSKIDNSLFYVTDDFEHRIKNLPTLIIGWERTKKLFPKLDILNWQIENDVFWTFGKRERNYQYENDIERFKDYSLKKITENIEYKFFNVLIESKENKKYFFNLLKKNEKNLFLYNGMLYIYLKDYKKIYGVLLKDIDYEGGSSISFLKKINIKKTTNWINQKDILNNDLFFMFKNTLYMIPYIFC